MPVYLRKNMVMSPPSESEFPDSCNDEDFIQDPDQMRDPLPQPYRMLDKVVTNIIDDAWDIISYNEEERVADASRLRPPQYECGIQLQDHGNTTCMCATPDGQYILLGMPDGLAAIGALQQETVAVWKDDKLDLVSISVTHMDETTYIVTTISDMGVARLFALTGDGFYMLQTLNEQEGDKKTICTVCQASTGADYIGVGLECPGSQECWLEIHKLPKDVWPKELESAGSKAKKVTSSTTAVAHGTTSPVPDTTQGDGEPIEYAHTSEGVHPSKDTDPDQLPTERSQSPGSQHGGTSPTQPRSTHFKFTSSTLVLKVRPHAPLAGISWSSALHLSKTVDGTGDVIGTGTTHLLSNQNLEQRNEMFEQLHEQYMKYTPKEDTNKVMPHPTFHFLQAGRILPHGIDQSSLAGQPTTVLMWWSGQPNVMQYSLVKQHKELEHKADVVWPLSSPVVASTISPCTSLVALGLLNNNVVIWDKYMGIPRNIIHMADEGRISKMFFLDPSICPQESSAHRPYVTRTEGYLMVTYNTGQVFVLNSGMGEENFTPKAISLNIDKPQEVPTVVEPIDGMPELIVTCRQNGQTFLQDVLRNGQQLCEVCVPHAYELTTPWEPVVVTGGKGQMLYIKGSLREAAKTDENDNVDANDNVASTFIVDQDDTAVLDDHALFVFQMRSFPTLDRYRSEERPLVNYVEHTTVTKRVEMLMTERLSQQALRKDRMQQRWTQLQMELEMIKQMRDGRQSSCPSSSGFVSRVSNDQTNEGRQTV